MELTTMHAFGTGIVLVVGCSSHASTKAQALLDDPSCTCVCTEAGAPSDAAVDATADARTTAISLTTPWNRTIVTPGSSSGQFRGADGVARDSEGCWVTAWEEGAITTRACPGGGGWVTELVAVGLTGAEDAKAGDLDGDGTIDVVTCADAGQRCYITFRGGTPVTTTLTGSLGHGHAMQAAIADVNGDGRLDVIFGTRIGPAAVGWLENPGATARDGSTWPFHLISAAGWTMSLYAYDVDADGDIDVIVSDRTKLADGTWGLYGARWEEQTPTGWVNHPISWPAGSGANHTPGDEMFLTIVDIDGDGDLDVVDCTSALSQTDSRIVVHRNDGGWLTWSHTVLPAVPNVGHCQGVAVGDLDGDGLPDIAVSTWKGNTYPVPEPDASKSGLYWLRNDGLGGWQRGEVSGSVGGKFDNVVIDNGCLMDSEQLDPAGGLGVVRYCPP